MRSLNPRGSRQRANTFAVRAVISKVGSWQGGLPLPMYELLKRQGSFQPEEVAKGYEGWAAQQDEQPSLSDEQPSLSEALRRLIETG
jgi:hypothetical protein